MVSVQFLYMVATFFVISQGYTKPPTDQSNCQTVDTTTTAPPSPETPVCPPATTTSPPTTTTEGPPICPTDKTTTLPPTETPYSTTDITSTMSEITQGSDTTTPLPTSVTTTEAPTDLPATKAPPFECPRPFGSYPHEFSCILYYLCKFEKHVLMKCAHGKYFDRKDGKCTKDPSVCKIAWRGVGCTEIGLFPVPNSCTDYYSCKSELGLFSRRKWSCLRNQYFDPEERTCVPGDCPGEVGRDEE